MTARQPLFDRLPVLESSRLAPRRSLLADTDALFDLYSDPDVTRHYELETFVDREQAVDLIQVYDQRFDRGILGYDLLPQLWGQGLMTEALDQMLTIEFEQMALNRVKATVSRRMRPLRDCCGNLESRAKG